MAMVDIRLGISFFMTLLLVMPRNEKRSRLKNLRLQEELKLKFCPGYSSSRNLLGASTSQLQCPFGGCGGPTQPVSSAFLEIYPDYSKRKTFLLALVPGASRIRISCCIMYLMTCLSNFGRLKRLRAHRRSSFFFGTTIKCTKLYK